MRFSSSPQFISVVCYDRIRSWNRATLIALKGKKWGEVWLKIAFGLNIFKAANLFPTNCSTVKDPHTSFLEWGVHRARLSHLSWCGQDTESKYGSAVLLFFVQVFYGSSFLGKSLKTDLEEQSQFKILGNCQPTYPSPDPIICPKVRI